MNEALIIALAAGVCLGGFFYGGLFWTVQRLLETKRPIWLVMVSFFLRMLVASLVFLWFATANLLQFAVCLVGFWLARFFFVHRLKQYATSSKQE